MADTESVELVVRAGDIANRDGCKGLVHVSVIALRKKKPLKSDGVAKHCLKDGNVSQEALVHIEIVQLSEDILVGSGVDHLGVCLKHCMVFRDAAGIHPVTEGCGIAAVIIVRFITEIDRCCFQHAAVGDGTVLTDNNIVRDAKQIFFYEAAAKQFVGQSGSNTEFKIGARINHAGIYHLLQFPLIVKSCGKRYAAQFFPVRHDRRKITVNDICLCFLGVTAHPAVHAGGDPVIAVYKGDILSDACADAVLSGGGMAAVFLVKALHLRMFVSIAVAYAGGTVGGAVVYQDQLIIRVILCQDAVEAAGQIFLGVVYRYDNTQERFIGHNVSFLFVTLQPFQIWLLWKYPVLKYQLLCCFPSRPLLRGGGGISDLPSDKAVAVIGGCG